MILPTSDVTFQLTHSRGVRLYVIIKLKAMLKFQLTHSRGVRLQANNRIRLYGKFQLTHSRGVRRVTSFTLASIV